MAMDPHLLRTFVTVARLGSFSRAAHELGYTQSAVSQHIATLEHDIGTELLHRRPVRATEIGKRLLEHARPILLRIDSARADMARLRGVLSGRVVVGATPLSVHPRWLQRLATARDRHPHLEVTMRLGDRDEVRADVATGRIDVAFVDGPALAGDPLPLPEAEGLVAIGVLEEPLVVAVPAGHPLTTLRRARLDDLADARWLDAPAAAVPLTDLRTAADPAGFRPAMRYEAADLHGLAGLVAAGHGLAVLPRRLVEREPDLVGIAVSSPPLVHRVEIVHPTTLPGPARTLADALAPV